MNIQFPVQQCQYCGSTNIGLGQYQHGSARWMSDAEKEKAFDNFILDPDDSAMRELLKTGCDGLDFMKK